MDIDLGPAAIPWELKGIPRIRVAGFARRPLAAARYRTSSAPTHLPPDDGSDVLCCISNEACLPAVGFPGGLPIAGTSHLGIQAHRWT